MSFLRFILLPLSPLALTLLYMGIVLNYCQYGVLYLGSHYNTGPYINFPHFGNSNLGKLPHLQSSSRLPHRNQGAFSVKQPSKGLCLPYTKSVDNAEKTQTPNLKLKGVGLGLDCYLGHFSWDDILAFYIWYQGP